MPRAKAALRWLYTTYTTPTASRYWSTTGPTLRRSLYFLAGRPASRESSGETYDEIKRLYARTDHASSISRISANERARVISDES
jgi:hypothetical protein